MVSLEKDRRTFNYESDHISDWCSPIKRSPWCNEEKQILMEGNLINLWSQNVLSWVRFLKKMKTSKIVYNRAFGRAPFKVKNPKIKNKKFHNFRFSYINPRTYRFNIYISVYIIIVQYIYFGAWMNPKRFIWFFWSPINSLFNFVFSLKNVPMFYTQFFFQKCAFYVCNFEPP